MRIEQGLAALSMTDLEQAAFHAGIRAAIDMALTTAITIEIRDDAREVRQQAAAAALHGLAEGLKAAFLKEAHASASAG